MTTTAKAHWALRVGCVLVASGLASCGGSRDEAGVGSAADEMKPVRAQAVTPEQAALAKWTAPIGLSLVPVSGAVLNTGKVLFWAADTPTNFGPGGTAVTTLFDPATNTAANRTVTETQHDMFCPGTTMLADGRLLVNGGWDSSVTSLYDPARNTWSRAANMNVRRGYNANTILSDGSVLTVGASWVPGDNGVGAKPSEVFSPTGGWRLLNGVTTANPAFLTADPRGYFRSDNHMWLIPTANGKVLHAGPSRTMNWIDTRGDGLTTPAGLRSDDTDSMTGNAVMYEAGKILTVGGSVAYDNDNGTFAKSAAYAIDVTSGAAQVRKLAPMAYQRMFANSVVLPNGQVVVLGGQTQSLAFSDAFAVLPAELWDPQTETFAVLPAMSVARTYHSIGLLLPDARVVSAGGGLCSCAGDHPDMQILSPPYLFNADGTAATRPTLTAAPTQVVYGGTASVSTDSAVTAFSMIRMNATTHGVNNDQRRVSLPFTAGANNSYQIAIPTNPGILLPGQWMLFATNANGTPSVARIITVSNTGAPVLQNPGDVTTTTGAALNIPASATTPTGTLVFSAGGLPAGLTLNANSGAITGAVASPGRYVVTLRVANGVQTVSTDFVITSNGGQGVPSVAAIANQLTPLGSSVSLAVSASDPGGTALTYSADGLPAGLTINPQNGVISGTASSAGTRTVTVTATNAAGRSASTSFGWTVVSGVPPVVSLPAPVATSGSTVNYNPTLGSGASAQFSWNFGDGSADTPYAASAAARHVFAAPGIYTVTLAIRTADGQTATQRFVQAVVAAGAISGARASTPILLEPRSGSAARLWVVNADNDSVSVFDTANNAKLAEIAVGAAPRTLALAADGRLWVVNKQGASISIVNPATLAVAQTVSLPRASQPYGIVFSPADGSAFVTLEATGLLLKLNGSTGAQTASLAVGDNPRHMAMNAAGTGLFLSRFISKPLPGEGTATVRTTDANGNSVGGEVLVISPIEMSIARTVVLAHSTRTDTENQGRGLPNYLGAAALSPDGSSAWVPSKQDNLLRGSLRDGQALNFQSTVRSISSRIDLGTLNEDVPGRVDHDNASVASAAVYHPSGAYLFVALETNRQVAVLDAAGKRELFRYEVGLAPQGLVVSADGQKLYVDNFMGRSVSVIDLTPLIGFGQTGAAPTATLARVAADKLTPAVLRGKQLFYDARDPRLARESYMSCASCHNDGGHDGRTWDFTGQGEGLRNTIALKGRAGLGQGFLHWSANFDEAQDFEGQIRSLAGGTGLMADADFNGGTRSQPLGDRKAGLSADLDALAAYMGSLNSFAVSPYRNADSTLTAAAQAGKTVFTTTCASCHGGAGFTNSADGSQIKNIGTLKASSGKRLNATLAGIDIPTLRDVWATAPYLHDGSAATLSAAVGAHNNLALNASDLANVVAYVQQIGSEELQPLANLALGKSVRQSSAIGGGFPERAVDGNTDGNWYGNSVTHTDTAAQPWWQVDLGQASAIQSVRLWNRSDCCADRLSNVVVFVSASDMSGRTLAQLNADGSVVKLQVASLNGATSVTLPLVAQGRYVKVQLSGSNYLSLAEVQVFGVPSAAPTSAVNVASGKAAKQSSDAYGGSASRAVDGNTSGTYFNNSVTHTAGAAAQDWWQVDLGNVHALDAVTLWNRTDCCTDRLSNFVVLASPTDMTGRTLAQLQADTTVRQVQVASLNGNPTLGLTLGGFSARYVRIQLSGTNYLSLAEVQVFGR